MRRRKLPIGGQRRSLYSGKPTVPGDTGPRRLQGGRKSRRPMLHSLTEHPAPLPAACQKKIPARATLFAQIVKVLFFDLGKSVAKLGCIYQQLTRMH